MAPKGVINHTIKPTTGYGSLFFFYFFETTLFTRLLRLQNITEIF